MNASAVPHYLPPSETLLSLDSTVGDLGRYQFEVDVSCLLNDVLPWFERDPRLPGLVLREDGHHLGLLPRSRLLNILLRSQSNRALYHQPLSFAFGASQQPTLTVPVNMPILAAAQQALRRSLIDQPIPIVVEEHNGCHSLLDVHELNIAHWQLRGIEVQTRYERTQVQMIRNERMANLGRLVDGVAHEILDPVGFIWGNLSHINDYTQQLLEVLAAYQAQVGHLPPGSELSEDLSDVDELAYIQADLPKAIASVKGGAQRLKTLAASLQNFCHIDDVYPKPADLHETLDSLVLLINSRLNGEIQFTREYGHLPPVICYAGQLSQAMMTLLLKLVDELLGDAVRRAVTNDLAIASMSPVIPTNTTPPEITLTTQVVSDVHLSPNGWITPRHDLFDWKQSGVETTPDPASKRWVSIQFSRNGDRWSALHQQQLLNAVYGDRWETHPAGFSTSYRVITVQHSGQLRWRSPTLPNANDPKFGAAFEILMPLI